MIIGGCPYCDVAVMTPIAPTCPTFSKEICEHCGKQYWLRHSRFDPAAYTLEAFDAEFIVDEKTKEILRHH